MQRADAEAAKVYEEFVDSFAEDTDDKSFVRGGTIQPGSAPTGVHNSDGSFVNSALQHASSPAGKLYCISTVSSSSNSAGTPY